MVIQTPSLPGRCLNNVSFPLFSMEQKIGFLSTTAWSFQTEIGSYTRILKLSRFLSSLSIRIGLTLPSVASKILKLKIGYIQILKLLTSENDSIANMTFRIIASQNVYNISLVKQCIFWTQSSKLTVLPKSPASHHLLQGTENVHYLQ